MFIICIIMIMVSCLLFVGVVRYFSGIVSLMFIIYLFQGFAEAMDRDFTSRDPAEEEMMNNIIAGDGDDADYSSQFLNLEDLDDRRDGSGEAPEGEEADGSGEAPEGEDDGSGSRTLVITKTSDVY